ncbi:hypothetical protein GCM10027028_64840 [Streptomyces sundarbansensis]
MPSTWIRDGWVRNEGRGSGSEAQDSGSGDGQVTLPGVRERDSGPKLGCRDPGVGMRDPGFERLLLTGREKKGVGKTSLTSLPRHGPTV